MIKPVIVSIAKFEENYIEEFVNYHLNVGFDKIYIYDNEDIPKYQNLLTKYSDNVVVIHMPFNNYYKPVQLFALDHFKLNYLTNDDITHVAHINIDEFIVLKKHKNIKDFIKEYFLNNCAGIGMNLRYFGLSPDNINTYTKNPKIPLSIRFIECDEGGDPCIKTIFDTRYFDAWSWSIHHIKPINNYFVKSTGGKVIEGPLNKNIDFSVIQLNSYKCKSFEEFNFIHLRGRPDLPPDHEGQNENVIERYNFFNKYDSNDYYLFDYYSRLINYEDISNYFYI
jgi:hypothetical protein